jgi:hypothetical protein
MAASPGGHKTSMASDKHPMDFLKGMGYIMGEC